MTNKEVYIVLVADDSDEYNLVCRDVCDTEEEARELEQQLLKDDTVEYVSIYKGVKLQPHKEEV